MRSIIIIGLCFLIGCDKNNQSTMAGYEYFPAVTALEDGLVWKYYYHRGKPGQERKTDILYRKLMFEGSILERSDYNAAFQLTRLDSMDVSNGQWRVIAEKTFDYGNVLTEKVKESKYLIGENNVHLDWTQDSVQLDKSLHFENSEWKFHSLQTNSKDTLIFNKPAKLFSGIRTVVSIHDSLQIDTTYLSWKKVFQKGLGMTQSILTFGANEFILELDEIISVEEFDRRANHGTRRVAYIDTLLTLDDYQDFRPCYHIDKINDYYNDRRSQIKGGKGRLRAMLNEKLDSTKIQGESGYLTYRFVVNCKGEAGWFVTEEASLDYEKKQFSQRARSHLFELLKAEQNWVHLEIKGNPRDAYTYITFKLRDGEIIELLP